MSGLEAEVALGIKYVEGNKPRCGLRLELSFQLLRGQGSVGNAELTIERILGVGKVLPDRSGVGFCEQAIVLSGRIQFTLCRVLMDRVAKQ